MVKILLDKGASLTDKVGEVKESWHVIIKNRKQILATATKDANLLPTITKIIETLGHQPITGRRRSDGSSLRGW